MFPAWAGLVFLGCGVVVGLILGFEYKRYIDGDYDGNLQ